MLLLSCDESQCQHKNKELIIERFFAIIEKGLKVHKKRKDTKPTKSSIEKRLEKKRTKAYKKALRNRPDF